MNTKTAKLVSPERVKKLFECYGADPILWPMDEKVSALSLIQHSGELRKLQQEFAEFDELLKKYDVASSLPETPDAKLLKNIVGSLPDQEKRPNKKYINHVSSSSNSFFDLNRTMGAVAASIAIVAITLSIVNLGTDKVRPAEVTVVAKAELDRWMWEQVVGGSTDESEEPLSMMTLLELEEI